MTHRKTALPAAIAASVAALALNSAAHAFLTPAWARPADALSATALKTTYQYFEVFDDDDLTKAGVQDLNPDGGANPNGNASVTAAGNGGITSTGHIYSPYARLDLKVNVPGYAPTAGASTKFLVQIQTEGSELVRTNANPLTYDFSAFLMNGTPLTSLRGFKYTDVSRETRDDAQGQSVLHAFAFSLPSTATTYQLSYKPLGTSCSQAYVSVDTFVAVAGDLNYDGVRDARDIDLLLRTTSGATTGATPPADDLFDVTGDGQVVPGVGVAGSDADAWVKTLAQTRYGDANLDGKVNFDDLVVLAQNYNKSANTWAQGDFNGSGTVNFDDLVALSQNYNFGSPAGSAAASFANDWALAQSLVPEPTTIASLAGLGGVVIRRRKAFR